MYRYLAKQRANIYHTESICDLDEREPSVSFDDENQEQDHTAEDAIIEKKLTDSEKERLSCYVAGMKFSEIARFLSVNPSTIWRSKIQIQRKYLTLTGG